MLCAKQIEVQIMKTKSLLFLLSLSLFNNSIADDGNIITDVGGAIADGAEAVFDAGSAAGEYLLDGAKEFDSSLKTHGVYLGVSLFGRKVEDEHEFEGAILVNYKGYTMSSDTYDIVLVPTNFDISVGGERVMVFTDAATLEYWGDDFDIAVNAVSLDYRKNEGLKLEKSQDLTALEIKGVKYFTPKDLNDNWRASGIDFEIFANIGLGGRTELITWDNEEKIDYSGNKYFSADVGLGANIKLTSDLPGESLLGSDSDLYLYGGARYNRSEDMESFRTYIGAELYTGKFDNGLTVTPYFDIFWEDINYMMGSSDQKIDGMGAEAGIRVYYVND